MMILAAFALIALNGYFVAAEFGLVKLRRTRVQTIAKQYGWRGRILLKVHLDPDAYLSACQLGITAASLGLGWIGEPAFARILVAPLTALGIENESVLHGVSFFIAFSLISYLHIVAGEQAPKSLAIRQAEKIGIWTAPLLYAFYWMMFPAIWFLNHSAGALLRLMGLDLAKQQDSEYATEELKMILRGNRLNNRFSKDEWHVLAQALDFGDLDVGDLMRPANEMVWLSETEDTDTNIAKMIQSRFSRYPLLDREGKVIGIIHVKDAFSATRNKAPFSLRSLARPIEPISTHLPATELFRRFRSGAPHFTVVTTQQGRPLGFITLDNLLSALVGEIHDEFKQPRHEWTKLPDGSLIGKGSLSIFSLEQALGIDIEETGVDSVGGLIMQRLNDVPKEGARVSFHQFDIEAKQMKGPRIITVRVIPKAPRETI
ncbi:MAG: hemolysin family protein [Burkholderiales bacterium]|jgi:CBS domain containing-hemolysin-like protein|nr:hemolysin family protein [Burkholderiales bacterium]